MCIGACRIGAVWDVYWCCMGCVLVLYGCMVCVLVLLHSETRPFLDQVSPIPLGGLPRVTLGKHLSVSVLET